MRLKRGKRLYLGYRAMGVPPKLAAECAGMALGDARRWCERCGGPKTAKAIMCRQCRDEAAGAFCWPQSGTNKCLDCGGLKCVVSERCQQCNGHSQRKAAPEEVVRLYRSGLVMREVGQQTGISWERVRQILVKVGESSRRRGAPSHDPTVRLNRRERGQWRRNYRWQRRFYRRYRAAKAYKLGMSLTEVAVEVLGSSHASSAVRALRGVPMRPSGCYDRSKRASRLSTAEVDRLLDGRERTMTAKQAATLACRASHRRLRVTRRSLPGGMVAVRCNGPKQHGDGG